MIYNFKTIAVVPSAKDFIDVTLSKTQRKTPTVVHKGYKISRIRKFYMRKVKFTQQNYHDRIQQILDDFPRLDDIHPFYADLFNILYSKDHYKLALGQINTAKTLIDNLGKDYLKLLKFGDSLYRCKELKRAALGRMCTVMKKLDSSLKYLEHVRQHMSRLPAIDPNTRTLLITGYPNVGKSSFINRVSQANVDVQPYAFTTKSLFVGHCDYKYMRWQVIDTPGILDHPLEERNTIEMQAITALAHLHATIMFFIDISEQCGYTIKQQTDLYHSIKPLFANKPLLIVATKSDLRKLESLEGEDRDLVMGMLKDRPGTQILSMSNISTDGINNVMQVACDMLLAHRVEKKLKSKRVAEIVNRIHIARPVPRDNKARPTSIPASVLEEKQQLASGFEKPKIKTEKDLMLENGGAGVYNTDDKKRYLLADPEWRYDIVPEILDGHNIADFIDPDIEAKLAELEREEEELQKQYEEGKLMADDDTDSELDEETMEIVDEIREKKKILMNTARTMKSNNKPIVPRKFKVRSAEEPIAELKEKGIETDKLKESLSSRSRSRSRKSLKRAHDENPDMQDEESFGSNKAQKKEGQEEVDSKARATSRLRSKSRDHSTVMSTAAARAKSPFSNPKQKQKAEKLSKTVQRERNLDARQGESDRRVFTKKPKHLFSGKRGIGSTDRR